MRYNAELRYEVLYQVRVHQLIEERRSIDR